MAFHNSAHGEDTKSKATEQLSEITMEKRLSAVRDEGTNSRVFVICDSCEQIAIGAAFGARQSETRTHVLASSSLGFGNRASGQAEIRLAISSPRSRNTRPFLRKSIFCVALTRPSAMEVPYVAHQRSSRKTAQLVRWI
jgi:hypothetical protein